MQKISGLIQWFIDSSLSFSRLPLFEKLLSRVQTVFAVFQPIEITWEYIEFQTGDVGGREKSAGQYKVI